MTAQYGEEIRKYLPTETGLYELVDFTNYSAFEGITAYSAILVGGNKSSQQVDCISLRSEEAVDEFMSRGISYDDESPIIQFMLPVNFLEPDRWLILPDDERRIVDSLTDRCSQYLGDVATVGSPLKTGKDELLKAVIQEKRGDKYQIKNERFEVEVESELWRKLIAASDAGDWTVEEPREVVFFPYERNGDSYDLIPESQFKNTQTYECLKQYKNELLDDRRDSGETFRERGETWYSLARYGKPDLFEHDKIAIGGTINGPGFSLDTYGYIVASGAGNARGISAHELDDYYLLGYLNSRAVYGYLKSIASPKSGGYISVENNVLERVPVVSVNVGESTLEQCREIILEYQNNPSELLQILQEEADSIIEQIESNSETAYVGMVREVSRYLCENHRKLPEARVETLEELNHYLVYKLVGFTQEDISIIEKNL
jgi:hypothetical protein